MRNADTRESNEEFSHVCIANKNFIISATKRHKIFLQSRSRFQWFAWLQM